ncbi:[NiFe] hydrogenase metallocenter assembly protein HypF [Labilithrix luteola]|uniref:acylphosphatase n=1 Tax=Labilithrix luteola TaxID=1391654 RepID=A0A0K1QD67_9BACT|nr:carbamoyltransferase HypF [Labilithrix luteola]AKV03370.1 [NiFe] hydrogenase metallocenter assembly protein HypF [Labilithrix luteola]
MIATNAAQNAATTARSRFGIRVRGVVQGVGFRPAVFRIAEALRLVGFVRNDAEGVWIEVEGCPEDVARFPESLRRDAPALSRIDALEISPMPPGADAAFLVVASAGTSSEGAIVPADVATCEACLRELFDVDDRRYRYPFVNCTDCGPRYTIVHELPYDRPKTTMAAFDMCPACRAEYEDPANRRFHAEPNACPACGPRVALVEGGVRTSEGDTAMLRAAALLGAGRILAVKGLGGYQLAVSATSEEGVERLRERKRRPHKPLAVMARDLATVDALADSSPAERRALTSPARPIVLLRMRTEAEARVAKSVAPRLGELGVMLPSTPLHHLLLRDGEPLLVMTSGNVSDEPIAKDDDEALTKLADIADAFLVHDRRIHTRADDSVVRGVAGVVQPVRRARGLVPDSIPLPFEAGGVLAVGAELKSTVCLTRGREAFVSQHIGDLEGLEARAFFEEVVQKLGHLLGTSPSVVAHDLHPDYASTRWAIASGLRRCVVQHHHAHVASCMAENGRIEQVIGVAFDGTGCGPAGDLWGGEVLLADLGGFERRGHLRPIALAGAKRRFASHGVWRRPRSSTRASLSRRSRASRA